MRQGRYVRFLTVFLLLGFLQASRAHSEDTKGKWQFGFGLSYFSTTDYIRSNSDLAFATGVPSGNGLPPVSSIDERPDINILNQASIADDFKLDVSASYGLTRWLAVEAAAGYQRSAVGNLEFFSNFPTQPLGVPTQAGSFCGPDATVGQPCQTYLSGVATPHVTNTFVQVGHITKIPVQLSGLVRFRPESPFDPYIGLGVGYIFASLQDGSEFKAQQQLIATTKVTSADEGEFTNSSTVNKSNPNGFFPIPPTAKVRNSFEWHAIGGVDYYVNSRLSFYVDARYGWTAGAVDIRTDGAHQVRLGILNTGQLLQEKRQFAGAIDPLNGILDGDPNNGPYLWEDVGLHDNSVDGRGNFNHFISCDPGDLQGLPADKCSNGIVGYGDKLFETEDHNLNGLLDINSDPNINLHENDGVIDVYVPGPIPTFADPARNNQRFPDPGEAIGHFNCPQCIISPDPVPSPTTLTRTLTEDQNYNNYMDRFLLYGIDICTTAAGVGNPVCGPSSPTHFDPTRPPNFILPGGGCPRSPPTVPKASSGFSSVPEGCPRPPASSQASMSTASTDDVSDVIIVQGGKIRLSGFALGFGFKFNF